MLGLHHTADRGVRGGAATTWTSVASPSPTPYGPDRKPPGGGSTVWSRAPFGTSNQRCLHVNGTATPTAVLGRTCRVRLPRQRIQHSRPLPLCYALARTTRRIPRLGTRLKAKVRLAAAVCLLTAVALELSAGWTRAAKLTRTQGRPHGPASPPRSGPSAADCASNLKSPLVAFGISRPTRTPPGLDRCGRLPTAGWTGTPSRPGFDSRQPDDPRLHVRYRHPSAPEARH